MNDADEALRNEGDPESLQQSMDEAQRQLEGARDRASEARQRAMQDALNVLANRANRLHDTQGDLERQLQEAVREAMENRDSDPLYSGLSWEEELEIADEKRQLLAELQRLQQDAQAAAQSYDDVQPRAADEIREGLQRLRDIEVEARIAVAAAYIEQGEAVYVASSESAVTEALRRLRDDLQRASDMAGPAADGEPGDGEQMRATLAEARDLRRALQRAAAGESARDTGAPASGPDTRRDESTGVRVGDLETTAPGLREQSEAVSQAVLDQLRMLAGSGIDPRDIDELRRLAAGVRSADFSGNPDILAREARLALELVEQLELGLARAIEDDRPGIRSNANEEIADQHRKIVADYYRRLGGSEEDEAQ